MSIEKGGCAAASLPAMEALTRRRGRTRWWVEALALLWLLWLYDALANTAPLRMQVALGHATGVLHLEQSLHLDPERTLDHWLAAHPTIGLVASDYYDNAHFIVTLGLLGWLWWRRADLYRSLRSSLVLTNLLAFAVFWRFPVAPPRKLAGYVDVVAATHAIGSWHTGALASHADELAAMPSLHVAWAAWCGLVLWRISERLWVRAAAVLYPCLTALVVLATGNHFVLDVLGGLGAMAAAALLAGPMARRPARSLKARLTVEAQRRAPVPTARVTKLLRTRGPATLQRAAADV